MKGTVRSVGALTAVLVAVSLSACAADDGATGSQAAACAYEVTYQGRTYGGVGDVGAGDVPVGAELGRATLPPCNDHSGSDETATTERAYAVEGVAPKVAIAVGATPDEVTLVAVRAGGELPQEVRRLIDDK
ncbi:DUF6281 family protein [Streptomyces sp. NPDC005955]|uniref:DUF6281 family protein n=1 Tax=Streptomyces sp. NPDC005955 TaxID=3364738 RepID=UPI0036826BF4